MAVKKDYKISRVVMVITRKILNLLRVAGGLQEIKKHLSVILKGKKNWLRCSIINLLKKQLMSKTSMSWGLKKNIVSTGQQTP